MKVISKLTTFFLILALFTLTTTGCSLSNSTTTNNASIPSEPTNDSSVTSAITDSDRNGEPTISHYDSNSSSDAPSSDLSDTSASSQNNHSSDTSLPDASQIAETTLLDQDGITITAKAIDYSGFFGPELKLLIENNSSNAVTIQCRNASVNGYMVETLMSVDVSAGKKATDSLTFMNSSLEAAGITTIADIEFNFHVYDPETWDTVFDSETIRLETPAASGFNYAYDDSGFVAYSADGIDIVIKGLSDEDSWYGPALIVYINNASNQNITVQVRNVSVNDYMIDSVFSCDVVAGKHAIDSISFMSSDLEANEIEEIEDIDLSFHVFDMDSWDTIIDTDMVSIQFD